MSNTTSNLWQPPVGATWNYLLLNPLNTTLLESLPPTDPTFSILDIDLFDNNASTISLAKSISSSSSNSTTPNQRRHIICYFSAGTYESWRSDASQFPASTLGNPLSDWPGEKWLNISSPTVRSIMTTRLDMAVQKGCDGVDPDNVDGYSNDNGLNLTSADSINYLHFLADETGARNLSIGLKNANDIIPDVIDRMQWSVNEQCHQYDECDDFAPFIGQGKPVFNVEYPKGDNKNDDRPITAEELRAACNDTDASGAEGFSTIVKNLDLDWWIETCGGVVIDGMNSSESGSGSGSGSGGDENRGERVGGESISVRGICTVVVALSFLFANVVV